MDYLTGEHLIFTALMTLMLLGAFLVLSLVMFWAPSTPFPGHDEEKARKTESTRKVDKP